MGLISSWVRDKEIASSLINEGRRLALRSAPDRMDVIASDVELARRGGVEIGFVIFLTNFHNYNKFRHMEPTRTKTRIFAAFLGAFGCGSAAHAETSVFGSTSTLLGFTATSSGIYGNTLSGARGGRGAFTNGSLGATVEGDIFRSAGTRLSIVVGGHGHTNVSVGGGGGCVYSSGFGPLFAVTGGGTGYTAGGSQGLSGNNQGAAVSGGSGGESGGGGGSFHPSGFTKSAGSGGVNSGNGSVSINDLSAFPATPEMDSWAIGAGLFALLGFEFVRRKVARQRLGGSL
jgi:hypothetical protein